MLHAYAAGVDVTENLNFFTIVFGTKQGLTFHIFIYS